VVALLLQHLSCLILLLEVGSSFQGIKRVLCSTIITTIFGANENTILHKLW
jgi:hypothetical protein